LAGRHIDHVEARGKHLLIHFTHGRTLYSHMRMNGSWHLYKVGERWRMPLSRARVALETKEHAAVCFNAPVVRLLNRRHLEVDSSVGRLGPDLLHTDFTTDDLASVRSRLRARNALSIGEVLMDQRALAGIGNVYKSELLFLAGINPLTRVGDLSDATLDALALSARHWLQHNMTSTRRETRPMSAQPVWAYGRKGQSCLRCGTLIEMTRQGEARRSTYWCPHCQPA
jgi:endonuclease VIII